MCHTTVFINPCERLPHCEQSKVQNDLNTRLCEWNLGGIYIFTQPDFDDESAVLRLHIEIPPTGYVGLILRSTAVATASRSTVEGTMRVL